MKKLQSLILLLFLPLIAGAEWIHVPLEALVEKSDLVVIGTLRDVAEETKDGVDYGRGEILVEEVLWGEAREGRKLSLAWQNPTNIDCPRVEHRSSQGKRAIWLLNGKADGEVTANYPGRVVEVGMRDKIVELLRGRRKI